MPCYPVCNACVVLFDARCRAAVALLTSDAGEGGDIGRSRPPARAPPPPPPPPSKGDVNAGGGGSEGGEGGDANAGDAES